jgi:hypothetical protein
VPGAISSLLEISLITEGLRNPIKTDAAQLIPNIPFVNKSILSPIKKESTINIQGGVSKGKRRINNTYKYGFRKPLKRMLSRTKTWIIIRLTKISRFFNMGLIIFF